MTHHEKPVGDPATDAPAFAAGSETLAQSLYDELRRAAHRERYRGSPFNTLQTTALIHEAFLKLSDRDDWESEAHFLAVASKAMRHVLIDAARERLAAKRGSGAIHEPIEHADHVADGTDSDDRMLRLGDALDDLARFDPELTRLVECRFFGGMTEPEVARALGISERTVRRRWVQARAWIHREMMD